MNLLTVNKHKLSIYPGYFPTQGKVIYLENIYKNICTLEDLQWW